MSISLGSCPFIVVLNLIFKNKLILMEEEKDDVQKKGGNQLVKTQNSQTLQNLQLQKEKEVLMN